MAITVQTTASGAGAPVAVENIGTSGAFQLVKLVGGSSGDTSPIVATSAAPAAGAVGMVVREAGTVAVTGAVAVSGGLVSVTGVVGISGITAWTSAQGVFFSTQALPVVLHQDAVVTVNQGGQTWDVRVSGSVQLVEMTGTTGTNVAASSTGLIVAVKPGVSVVAQVSGIVTVGTIVTQLGTLPVTGTIQNVATVATIITQLGTQIVTLATGGTIATVLGTLPVTGTIQNVATVATVVTILSTVNVAIVAGAGGGGSVTTAPPNITATGQVMWVAGGQSTTAFPIWVSQINPPAGGGGSVTTAPPNITATGQMMFIVGGQSTTANPVWVSQINPPAGGGGSVTTAVPSISATGQIMFVVGGQSTTANPVFVSHVATQVVSVVPGVSVQLVTVGTVLTIVTQLGTQVVSVVPGVSVNVGSQATGIYTTTATSGATGPIVWLGVGQTIAAINTLVTQLGTAVVTIAQTSVSVAAVPTVNTVVTILGTQVVTVAQTSFSVAAIPTVNTVVTILSTVNVAIVAGAGGGGSVTTTAPGITATGQVMWVVGGQSTTVSPVFVSVIGGNVVATTSQASGVTGALMYLAASQTIMVTNPRELFVAGGSVANSSTGLIVHPKYNQGMPFMLFVSSTVGGSVGTTLLFTVWTGGSLAGAALTQWAVPAGNCLRLMGINAVINSSAVTGGTFQVMVNAATASGSFTSAAQATIGRPMFLQMIVSAGVTSGAILGVQADIGGGTTIGVRNTAATAMVIGGAIIQGYLFD